MIVSEDMIELMYHMGVYYVVVNQPSEAKMWLEKASEHRLRWNPLLTLCVGQQLIMVLHVLRVPAHSR